MAYSSLHDSSLVTCKTKQKREKKELFFWPKSDTHTKVANEIEAPLTFPLSRFHTGLAHDIAFLVLHRLVGVWHLAKKPTPHQYNMHYTPCKTWADHKHHLAKHPLACITPKFHIQPHSDTRLFYYAKTNSSDTSNLLIFPLPAELFYRAAVSLYQQPMSIAQWLACRAYMLQIEGSNLTYTAPPPLLFFFTPWPW